MTATGHAVIGVAIAASIPNPFIAIPISIISHIAADAFPHWDLGTNRHKKEGKKSEEKFYKGAFLDLGVSFLMPIILTQIFFPETSLFYAYLNVIAAQLLDWLSAPYVFLRLKNPPIFYYVYKFQKLFDNRLDKPWGVVGQIGVVSALVLFVWKNL